MNRLITIVVTAAAALALVACGDDAKSSPTVASTSVVDETVVDETVVDETVVDDTEPAESGGGDGTAFCDVNTELNNDDLAMDGSDTPEALQNYFTVVMPEKVGRLEGVTPPELADDVATLIEGVSLFADVLADNDWDVEAAFADPALAAIVNDEEFVAAGGRVDAYCGV